MRARFITTCVVGVLMLQNRVPAQPAPPQTSTTTPAPIAAMLDARVYVEDADGRTPGTAFSTVTLATNEVRSMSMRATNACVLSTGTGTLPPPFNAPHAVEWTIDARLVSATEDTATVDLRWRRIATRDAVRFGANGAIEEEQRVVLGHGDWTTLDLLRTTAPLEGGGCRRLVVQIVFRVKVDPDTRDAAMRYDMWLVHRDANGRTTTERIQSTAEQDREVSYLFTPLDLDGRDASTESRLLTEISGTVRGRARRDGLVDVTLTTWRRVFDAAARRHQDMYTVVRRMAGGLIRETDSRGIMGNRGRKHLTVSPGETVEVALPALSERLGTRDLSQLTAGETWAIRITTTRVR